MANLAERVRKGDVRALARLLTLLENEAELGLRALDSLYSTTGSAWTIGITGPPGAGKSSLVNELIRAYRARDQRVAVIAVDPSSPLTGGAMLGDRIRMMEWHTDPGVFIRSMASRRWGGGLAQNTLAVVDAFDAAGFDKIMIETVGTGQDEVAIAGLALSTLLVQVPGTGDGVQALKAGALEIGDVLVVTKADKPEASELARDLRRLQQLTDTHPDWTPPVVKTSASTREGIPDLVDAISSHEHWLRSSGEIENRLQTIAAADIAGRVESALRQQLLVQNSGSLDDLVHQVVTRKLTPQRATERILQELRS